MENLPVHWSEGMFLRPHHFQAADRYWHEMVAASGSFDEPFNYGIFHVVVNREALANQRIEISQCQARFKNGTVWQQDGVLSLDLAQEFEDKPISDVIREEGPIRVYLAIPHLNLGRASVSLDGGPADRQMRYVEVNRSLPDESSGGGAQDIGLRDVNIRILLSNQELEGFETLPVCQLKQVDGSLVVDEDYFPPSLTIQSWPGLSKIGRDISDLINGRISTLLEQARSRGLSLASQNIGDIEKLWLMIALNEASATLNGMGVTRSINDDLSDQSSRSAGLHPWPVYVALCQIIGRVSIFGSDMQLPEIPPYQHDRLAEIYQWAMSEIRNKIFAVKSDPFEMAYFAGRGSGSYVTLKPEWFAPEWQWFFGVNAGRVKRKECFDTLKKHVDWVLGSSDMVEGYFQRREPGISLDPLSQAPPELPRKGNWLYFEVGKDDGAWNHVELSQSLSVRVSREQIDNLSELEGNRRLKVLANQQVYGFEFAIFVLNTQG